jgi:hypothetical protein
MNKIQVALINACTVLTDAQILTIMPALQTQVSRDLAPVWGTDANLTFVSKGSQPPANAWWLTILDTTDVATAVGYHDLTDQGLPMGKVFAETDLKLGYQWTATASHELLEMLADPYSQTAAFIQQDASTGILYAYEIADHCQADQHGYEIDGVHVSDFVYPAWFQSFLKPGSSQFDFCNHIQQPLQILPGGYISTFNLSSLLGWHQLTAEEGLLQYDMRPHVGSRRERRRTPRNQWLLSEVKSR